MLKFIKNNLYALLFLVILIGACFGGYKYYQSQKAAKTVTVKTASVEYGNLQKSVSATGSLSALDNVDISSKITGRIVDIQSILFNFSSNATIISRYFAAFMKSSSLTDLSISFLAS